MNDIAYHSTEHEQRFVAEMISIRKISNGKFDPEYGAALFLLTSDRLMIWEEAQQHVSASGIDFEALLAGAWSTGEEIMIKLANNLLNGNSNIDPVELMRLDENNFEIALEAIKIRRYGIIYKWDMA